MRLLKIGIYYSAYLEQFYAQRPGLAEQDYATQHTALMDDGFGSSNFWTNALTNLGYETCDLVSNAQPMQQMWGTERGLAFDPNRWLFDITAAQVKAFKPDALLVADYSTITAAYLRHLKDVCPSIRLVLVWCGAPFRDGSIFNECDIVLSCVPELVTRFRQSGHHSYQINHAFDQRVLEKLDLTSSPTAEFVFLGSIVKSDQFHIGREKLLSQLVKETDLKIWSDAGAPASTTPPEYSLPGITDRSVASIGPSRWRRHVSSVPFFGSVARRAWQLAQPGSRSLNVDPNIINHSQGPLFGLQMFQQLHDSRVALNTHIDISPINASNMRLFEATGVGACMLTDWKANLSELFELDSEVVTYRDADECVEQAQYLLEHESERRSIAAAGQRRTLRDHTFDHRAAQIDTIILQALAD
ncbi:MAG: glycosyltransferase [bacterium]